MTDASEIVRQIDEALSKGLTMWTHDARRALGTPNEVWDEVASLAREAGRDVDYIPGVRITVRP